MEPVITPSTAPAPASTTASTICVGTRKSLLALKQADFVIAGLSALHPGRSFEVRKKDAAADTDKTTALYNFGHTGLWTNELEAELVTGAVDLIVHSLKDMPTTLPPNCVLACIPGREDPRDVLVVKKSLEGRYSRLADLPAGSVVGTSSIRRMAQLRRRFPKLEFRDMRGNIDTRLRKLDDEGSEYTVLILGAAGLHRMGYEARVAQYLDSRSDGGGMLHAVGQGGLGIEVRADDAVMVELLRPFVDNKAMLACEAERSVMRTLEGGCSVPIGVETSWEGGAGGKTLRMLATVVSVDGTEAVDVDTTEELETVEQAVEMGKSVAQKLRDLGAQKILNVIIADRLANQDSAQPWVPA